MGTGENNSQRSVAYGDGVYKSIDGGKSWKNMGLEESEHIGKIVEFAVFFTADGAGSRVRLTGGMPTIAGRRCRRCGKLCRTER